MKILHLEKNEVNLWFVWTGSGSGARGSRGSPEQLARVEEEAVAGITGARQSLRGRADSARRWVPEVEEGSPATSRWQGGVVGAPGGAEELRLVLGSGEGQRRLRIS